MRKFRFDDIVFIDDFFRSSCNLLQSHPQNRRSLRSAFGASARRLGIPYRELAAQSDGGELDVASMVRAFGWVHGANAWAKSCTADLAPLMAAGLLPRLGPRTLVIGWGMPPSLMHWVDRQRASFIDIEIAPIRFAPHLSFHARTNDPSIGKVLGEWRTDPEACWNEAGILQGYFARHGAANLFKPELSIGLFCGQTVIDLAVVQEGKIVRPLDHLAEIRALAATVDILVIKPHPYEPDVRHLAEIADRIPNAAWTDASIYALLCAGNLEFASGLSSGALKEAAYFSKPSRALAKPDRDNPNKLPANCSGWISVGAGISSLEAMTAFCADSPSLCRADYPEDALDRIFGLRWGLRERDPGLALLPTLEFDTEYGFTDGSTASPWLSFGWSAADAKGVSSIGPRACIAIPLPESWPAAAVPVVQVNGRPWEQGRGETHAIELSARLDDAARPRLLTLEFKLEAGRRLHLRRLAVSAVQPQQARPRSMHAASGLGVAAVLCVAAVVALLMTPYVPSSSAGAAGGWGWSSVTRTLVSHMSAFRDDIHELFQHQRHEI